MRLPPGFRRVPDKQHDAENWNRTDYPEHKAIVCILGNRIHVLFLVAPNLAQRLEPNDRNSKPNLAIAIRFFLHLLKLDCPTTEIAVWYFWVVPEAKMCRTRGVTICELL